MPLKSFRRESSLKTLIIEVTSIVIGVLLALAANEWNEDRIHKQRVSEALGNIVGEIEQNQRLMAVIHGPNTRIVELLENEPGSQDDGDTENVQKFIPGLQIEDTAWKTLLATGVTEFMDYETLQQISSVYSVQEIYRTLGFQLIENMMNTASLAVVVGGKDAADIPNNLYKDHMVLLVQTEQALVDMYDNVLEDLNSRTPK